MKNSKVLIGCIQVEDKFGDNGITGVFIIKSNNNKELYIDTLLLSCRIIGREVEQVIMSYIIEKAKKEGLKRIIAEFILTKKNLPASDFLEKAIDSGDLPPNLHSAAILMLKNLVTILTNERAI